VASEKTKGIIVLTANTIAFTICFMCWMINGVLITYLQDNGVFQWDQSQIGWLIGIPVLTGAVTRLPVGVLTDKYGGRAIQTILMLSAAIPMYLASYANSYWTFLAAGLGFGLTGASFAVGIAYTSIWFKREHQGTALGIFGAGNAGAAITSIGAPRFLNWVTDNGANLDQWRILPRLYAAILVVTAILFFLVTHSKKVDHGQGKTLGERLEPLKHMRVWRFGLYYFFVFGGFVSLAQWLIPYYVNAYSMTVATAGLMASIYTLPSGVIRALGGYMSDKLGARTVMYWVLGTCLICCGLLIVPRMDIQSPGQGIMAKRSGTVVAVNADCVTVDKRAYKLRTKPQEYESLTRADDGVFVFPKGTAWQEPIVKVGDLVKKKQLLAKGVTHIYFQANVWIFTGLVFIIGIMMGIGKAAVYKHIPDYFPDDVGVVGGIVGVLGGLGGFVCPIVFGHLLKTTGIWTTCWMFFAVLVFICLYWMHVTIRRMMQQQVPILMQQIETSGKTDRVPKLSTH
jgi:MFS transporter, NNP family, nitrate/nitrite transporter